MFVLAEPSPERIARVVDSCASRKPNHPALTGIDLRSPPSGFRHDAHETVIGRGETAWAAARSAIDERVMYPSPWASVHTAPGPLAVGGALVAVIRHYGFFSILPGRIREVLDTHDARRRYGFSFLTLDGHAEMGIEQFAVSWDTATGDVRYEVAAISRPAGIVRLGAPVARRLQRRFQRDSVASVRRHVAERCEGVHV